MSSLVGLDGGKDRIGFTGCDRQAGADRGRTEGEGEILKIHPIFGRFSASAALDKIPNDRQVAYMGKDNLPGLSPLWLLALAIILGVFIVVAIPISITTGDSIKSSDWIGFSGSVAAGAMTLIAAALAWFAVQRQIQAQLEADARAVQRLQQEQINEFENAKYAARIVLAHTVHAAAAVMNITEQYLEASKEPPPRPGDREYGGGRRRTTAVKEQLNVVMTQLKATMSHFAVSEVWKDLDVEDKGNYLVVTSTLHTVMNVYFNPPPIPDLTLITNQHDTMSKFAIYLRAFDGELADVYERDSKL
jgi:hypothetical protein